MSEFTAVGPALNIDGPLPRPRPFSLLEAPGVRTEASRRVFNGVNVWGYPCDTPSLWEPCYTEGTFGSKLTDSTSLSPRFDSFVAYLPFTCSTITADPAEFARRTEAVIDATLSHAVEQALAHGVEGSTNPYFGDTNLDALNTGGVTDPDYALAYLEDAIGSTGRGGMIHATPGIISAWSDKLEINGVLTTANGTIVISGSGYRGAEPAAEQAPGAGQDWAFATGPVEVYVDEFDPISVSEFVDRSDNTATYRAERAVLAVWDTCLQSGVLVDWGSAVLA